MFFQQHRRSSEYTFLLFCDLTDVASDMGNLYVCSRVAESFSHGHCYLVIDNPDMKTVGFAEHLLGFV